MKYQINYGNGWTTISKKEVMEIIKARTFMPTSWKFTLERENYIKIKNIEIRKV